MILIGALFFGCLCLTLAAGLIYDARIHNRKRTLLAERHELRRVDRARDKVEYQAQALKRLDHLTDREISYIADCLRKNEQSITTWVYSPEMANLGAAGLVGSPGGKHHQDYYPYFIADFAWAELLKRKDEFIAKDDENERRKAEEKQRAMRR